jgi:hypothetical protein
VGVQAKQGLWALGSPLYNTQHDASSFLRKIHVILNGPDQGPCVWLAEFSCYKK